MDWKYLAVAGVVIAAIAVAGFVLYDDHKVVDADTEMWEIFQEEDDRICKLDKDEFIPLENLEGLEINDTVVVGKTWMEKHNDAATKEDLSALIEKGVRVLTLGNDLMAFESFMTDHCYEFEDEAYVYGAQMRNGVVFTLSLTAFNDESGLKLLKNWDTYLIPLLYKDFTTDWDLMLQSYSIREMWDDREHNNCMVQIRQYLSDSDIGGDYVLAVDKYTSYINGSGTSGNMMNNIKFDVNLSGDAADCVVDYIPTTETYTEGQIAMTYHGHVVVTNPLVYNKFITTSNGVDEFSVNYGVKKDNRDSTLTVYPAYMTKTDGEYSVHTDTSIVVDKHDSDDSLRYTFGSNTRIIL